MDWSKPVQTRDGRAVRVLCTDLKDDRCIVAAVSNDDGTRETVFSFEANKPQIGGMYIVNVPQRHVHADLIIAWANGAAVEYWEDDETRWVSASRPAWDPLVQYRLASF